LDVLDVTYKLIKEKERAETSYNNQLAKPTATKTANIGGRGVSGNKQVFDAEETTKMLEKSFKASEKRLKEFKDNAMRDDDLLLKAQEDYYNKSALLEADRIKNKTGGKNKKQDFDPKYADFLASDFALKQKQLQQDIDFEKARYNNEKLSFEDRKNAKILYQTWELDFIKNEQSEKERLLKQKLASEKEAVEKSYKDSIQNQENLARKNKAINALDKQYYYDSEQIKLEYNEKSQKIFDDYLNIKTNNHYEIY